MLTHAASPLEWLAHDGFGSCPSISPKFYGKRGDDIEGKGGNDNLFGQKGSSNLRGGQDDDDLYGGPGNDQLADTAGQNV